MKIIEDLRTALRMPRVSIDLMHGKTADNDPFYGRTVKKFYGEAHARHRKFPLIRTMEWGVALCRLPSSFDEYFMCIEAAGRRNYKKAKRNGYLFEKIDFNRHLDDIGEIRRSATHRQGEIPEELLGEVKPCENPVSKDRTHDYPYFGVLKDGKLSAYAGCLIAGELCMIEHIYGHADKMSDGVVPMLIVGMAGYVMENHPDVKYYGYGTYFGASESMRRFKRKFKFLPCRVSWVLG
jgi:hypothetical protein